MAKLYKPGKSPHEYLKDILDIIYDMDPTKFTRLETTIRDISQVGNIDMKIIDIHIEMANFHLSAQVTE